MYIVYETTNLIDGKYYIGVHDNNKRKNYLGSGLALKRGIKLYGKENFMRETLREFDNEQDAYDYERSIVNEWLVDNRNCYNLRIGGIGGSMGIGENHPNFGKRHSEETKKKISDAIKGENHHLYGKHISDETKLKMSHAQKGENHHNFGKTASKETKQKQSNAQKGRIVSEETKQKISDHGRKYIYHINGGRFNTIIEAGNYLKKDQTTIRRWCKDPNKPNCYRVLKDTI